MGYLFEWDLRKADANRRKHRVSFDEATTAFADPLAMLQSDPSTRSANSGILSLACPLGASPGGSICRTAPTDPLDLRAAGDSQRAEHV